MIVLRLRSIGLWLLHTLGAAALLLGVLGAVLVGTWQIAAGALPIIDNPWTEAIGSHHRKALPEEIGVTALVAEGSDTGILAGMLSLIAPIVREGCGGAAFRLSDETLAGLRSYGVRQLDDAKVGRGYRASGEAYFYTYQPWQETPVPSSWTSEGMWLGLGCLNDRSFDRSEVLKAAGEPGSYFTKASEIERLVIPRMRLIVLTYYG